MENLALLIARVREDQRLVNALARFALQVREHREKWFWQLSSEAMKQSLARKLEMYFCLWWEFLTYTRYLLANLPFSLVHLQYLRLFYLFMCDVRRSFFCDFVLLSLPAGPLSVRCLKQCWSFQTVDLYQALVRPSVFDLGSRFQLSLFSHLFGLILKASPPSKNICKIFAYFCKQLHRQSFRHKFATLWP